jgi:hypothetical protein
VVAPEDLAGTYGLEASRNGGAFEPASLDAEGTLSFAPEEVTLT